MSAHFAIPATTFVLKAILEARIRAAYGTFTAPAVSIEPPPRPAATPATGATPEAAGLTLFLHHAGPNSAWRNMYDPHIDSSGKKTGKAPLVLDLHYILIASGADLEREALFGIGLSAFHRNGIVPRPMIQALLGAVVPPVTPTRLMQSLTTEPLHDPARQPEQITITQMTVDLDVSTKLWSALQSPLRPSAFFLVTTVFLDTGETFPAAIPVDTLGLRLRPDPDPGADPAGDDLVLVPQDLP